MRQIFDYYYVVNTDDLLVLEDLEKYALREILSY